MYLYVELRDHAWDVLNGCLAVQDISRLLFSGTSAGTSGSRILHKASTMAGLCASRSRRVRERERERGERERKREGERERMEREGESEREGER